MVTFPAPHPGECLMPGQTGTAADVSGKQPVSSPEKVSEQAGRPMPRHIAIIMDGNGRWAQQKGLPRLAGHEAGSKSIERCVQAARPFCLINPPATRFQSWVIYLEHPSG
jgi:hypothetical protein